MTETSAADIRALQVEVKALDKKFDDHDRRDETRFADMRSDQRDQRKDIADLAKLIYKLIGAAVVLIPILTEVAHVFTAQHLTPH